MAQPEIPRISFLDEGRALEDHEYTIINQAESYEKMVGRLVTAMGLLDDKGFDASLNTLVRIHHATEQYNEHYWHHDAGRPVAKDIEAHEELFELTDSLEDVPVLHEALKLQKEMGRHNDAVLSAVYVVRLLVLQELHGQQQTEIPESA